MEFATVTYLLLAIITLVTIATLLWPPLANVIGGAGELNYPWQPWTAVFLHGWPGVPRLLHLAGNVVLIIVVGLPVERWLGSARFLLVTVLAIVAAGFARFLTGLPFNGASAFIWAYAPLLWLLIRRGQERDKAPLLWVMWLIVPAAMGIILALGGAPLPQAWLWGNVYHLSGTVVGFAAAALES